MGNIFAAGAILVAALSAYNALAQLQIGNERSANQDRNAYISQNSTIVKVNSDLINAIASAAATGSDEALRELLSSEGVTFSVNEVKQTDLKTKKHEG